MATKKLKKDSSKKTTVKKVDSKVLRPAKSGRITPAMARAAVRNVSKLQNKK